MTDLLNARRIVLKVGSSTLTHENGKLNLRRMLALCRVLSDLKNMGKEVILVSSGAIAVGTAKLKLSERPREMKLKQAAAAVGQCELMHLYDHFFEEYGQTVAQVLLTREDVDHISRRENVINTFESLLHLGCIPIVNENDTVAIDEIYHMVTFGENDTLAVIVAELCSADLLIMLSDIDGLYDADPRQNPDARLIPLVGSITEDLKNAASGAGTSRGTGGMATKLTAAQRALDANIPMIITNGERPELIYDIVSGTAAGTLFSKNEEEHA